MINTNLSLKKILTFSFQGNLRIFIFLVLGLVILSLVEVFGIASVGPFVAVLNSESLIYENYYLRELYGFLNLSDPKFFIIILGLISIFLITFSNIINALIMWQITYFSKKQGFLISKKLLALYLKRDYAFFLDKHSSEISRNILSEVKRIVDGIILPILQLISRIIVCLSIFIFLIFLNFQITLPIIIMIFLFYFIFFYFIKDIQKKIGKDTTKTVLQRFKIVNEVINGIKLIKLNSVEDKFIDKFSNHAFKEAMLDTKGTLIAYLPRYFIETIIIVSIISLILIIHSTTSTNISDLYPFFVVYALAALRLLPSVQQIYVSSSLIKYNIEAFKILVNDAEDSLKAITYSHKLKEHIKFNKSVELRNISYSFNNTKKLIIKNLNLKIYKNSSVGIFGKSGSGKSTLVDIISGLLRPVNGEILIDDIVLNNNNLNSWKTKIGYVAQDTFLFDGSIAENIAFPYHMQKIDMNMIKDVINKVNLNSYINSLPLKYDSSVGELGKKISGGQKQRIGIARALYRNPLVIILDEATSALDKINEDVVIESINLLKNKVTTIMISHKKENLKNCDIIMLLDQNKTVSKKEYLEL